MSIASDEAEIAARVDLALKQTEESLAAAYLKAADDTMQKLANLYVRGVVTFADAQKAGRLEKLLAQIDRDLERLTGKAYKLSYNQSVYSFMMGYQGTAYAVTNNTAVDIDFGTVNYDTIIASVQAPVGNMTLSDRFTLQRYDLLLRQRQTITQGLIQGWSIDKMAKAIDDIYSIGLNDSTRIARTETTRNNTEGQNEAYNELDAQGISNTKKWISAHDTRTRHSHAQLDGKLADAKGLFWIGSDSAKGPGQFSNAKNTVNCRCRIVTVLTDYDDLYPKYKDFNSWAKENGVKVKKNI